MAKDHLFKKGNPGKPKGAKNKVTQERRIFIKSLLDGEHDHIKAALDKTRTKYPHLYLGIISNIMEFDTPKLSRTEIKHEGEINTTAKISGFDPPFNGI